MPLSDRDYYKDKSWFKRIRGSISSRGLIPSRFSRDETMYYRSPKQRRRERIVRSWVFKLALNLLFLSLVGITVWVGVLVFARDAFSPLVGGVLFISSLATLCAVAWLNGKNKWRRPRLLYTIIVLLIIAVVFSFAGVAPFDGHKTSIVSAVSGWWDSASALVSDWGKSRGSSMQPVGDTSATTASPPSLVVKSATIPAVEITPDGIDSDGRYKNFQLGIVFDAGVALSGSGCYDDSGEFIILINNMDARNPTYSELLTFLKKDNTEAYPYHLTVSSSSSYYGSAKSNVDVDRIKDIIDGSAEPAPPNICADFAERLHNNAERAGVRAGYVNGTNHAFNVFETTDRGLVYIDDTGATYGPSGDLLVTIGSSGRVQTQWLFPEQSQGWSVGEYVGGAVYYKNAVWDGVW